MTRKYGWTCDNVASMEVVTAYETLGVDRTRFVGYDGLSQDTVLAAILVVRPRGLFPARTG